MSIQRRTLLKSAVAYSTIGIAISAGVLAPRRLLAAWPQEAFTTATVDEATTALLGGEKIVESDQVELRVKTEGEINAASLPVKVSTKLPADSITIIAEKNPTPLIAVYELTPSVEAYVSTKIKFAESSHVIAIVKAEGKLYSAKKMVEVAAGGCAA